MPMHWMKARHLENAPPMLGPKRYKPFKSMPWILDDCMFPWQSMRHTIGGDQREIPREDVLLWWEGDAGTPGSGPRRHAQVIILPQYAYVAYAYGGGNMFMATDNPINWTLATNAVQRTSNSRSAIANLPEEMRSEATRYVQEQLARRFGDAPW